MSQTNKKRKLSGLSGVHLVEAYTALLSLKKTFMYDHVEADNSQIDHRDWTVLFQ